MRIRTSRIHDGAGPRDGSRILIDRLWPRGISKEKAAIDFWAREAAPSDELRRWYRHDPKKWDEFRRRYFAELDARPEAVEAIWNAVRGRTITLVFGSRERELNNATAMREYLEAHPPA